MCCRMQKAQKALDSAQATILSLTSHNGALTRRLDAATQGSTQASSRAAALQAKLHAMRERANLAIDDVILLEDALADLRRQHGKTTRMLRREAEICTQQHRRE